MSERSESRAPRTAPSKTRRAIRLVAISVSALLLLVCVTLVATVFWLNTSHARDVVLEFAAEQIKATGGELLVSNASGTLLNTLGVERLVYRDQASDVVLTGVKLQWSPGQLFSRKLYLSALEADSINLELKPSENVAEPAPAAGLPDSIGLPIQVELSRLTVNNLSVKTAGADEPMSFSGIELAAQYGPTAEGQRFVFDEIKTTTPWGQLQNLSISMGDETPFPLSMEASWDGPIATQSLGIDLKGSGNLEDLDLQATATAGSGSMQLRAQVQPLQPALWANVQANIKNINSREFNETAPLTRLAADLKLTNLAAESPDADPDNPVRRDRINGTLTLSNQLAGPIAEDRLPLEQAAMQMLVAFSDDPSQAIVAVREIKIALSAQSEITQSAIAGDITVDLSDPIQMANQNVPAIASQLSFTGIDLNQWLETIPPTALVGQLELTRRDLNIDLAQSAAVSLEGLDFPGQAGSEPPSVLVRASVLENQLLIEDLRTSLNGAVLQLNGKAGLEKPFDLAFKGSLEKFDLDNWLTAEQQKASRLTTGQLNANFSVDGPSLAPAATQIRLEVFDSELGGDPLTLNTSALVSTTDQGSLRRVSDFKASLSLGKNQLGAQGALGLANDELKLTGKLPALNLFDTRLAGGLNLDATLRGAFNALRAQLRADGSRLRFQQTDTSLSLRSLELDADLPLSATIGPDENVALTINANRLQTGETRIRRTRLKINGTPDKHVYDASVSSGKWAGRLRGRGSADLDKQAWKTTINGFDIDGDIKVRLQGRPTLSVSAEQIDLQKLNLVSSAGRVSVNRAQVALGDAPDISIRASASRLIVSDLISLASQADVPAELSRLQAQAEIALEGTSVADLTGTVSVDLDEQANQDKPGLGITPGRVLTLRADKGNLDGRLALELPSLKFSQPYTGADLQIDGAVNLRADIGGTTSKPSWIAKINGSDITVLQRSVGWRLDKGILAATVTPQRVDLSELRISSGEGALAISGSADIPTTGARTGRGQTLFSGQFKIEPDRFVVPIGPGQRIALSGKTFLTGKPAGIDLTGDLIVDEGVIEVQGSGAPSAPSDIVFDDEQTKGQKSVVENAETTEAGAAAVRANLNIDTGQKLRVVGSGIRARLVGKLNLGGVLPDSPRLTGRVDVSDGSYRAYGQALDIKRGIVRFNGPADNPNLDILAIRPNLPVEVGVSVNGTAAVPTIELVSTPELPNAEKLSWLVLGAGLDSAAGAAQSLALQQAAKSLVGVDNSDEQGGIVERLGFDSLGLGYASDTGPRQGVTDSGGPSGLPGGRNTAGSVSAEEVVTVGKQLSSKVRISYEQGLRGIQNLLRIQYDVSQRLALRAQTGSDNAVDLLYFFSFD